MNSELLRHFKAARKCSVPILSISSADQQATIQSLSEAVDQSAPVFQYDLLRGFTPINKPAGAKLHELIGDDDESKGNPDIAIQLFTNKPIERAVLFVLNSHRFLDISPVMQAVANCRDILKGDGRTLVLLGPTTKMPIELAGDVVILDEPLPTSEQLATIAKQAHEDAGKKIEPEAVEKIVDAVQGLPAFQAEQAIALGIVEHSPIEIDQLWAHKKVQIEQTPGLKVWRGGERFDSIGGCDVIKGFVGRILKGNGRPNAIVFIDEIEKMFAGAGGDTSGVTQDQLGVLLSYMQDNNAAGMIYIGPPGSGKSAVAKAAGNEAGIPTIQLDLGASKGSLVGSSEAAIRNALKVVSAVSNGKSLWVCTCNAIASLPPELRRRFTLGTFFYDLPTKDERKLIWQIHVKSKGLEPEQINNGGAQYIKGDEGWTGAEIRQACDIAWRLGCTLEEAAAFVVPIIRSAGESIEKLRAQADGKFLSASYPGTYKRKHNAEPASVPANKSRRFSE